MDERGGSFDLGNNRYLCVSEYQGEKRVHIREYDVIGEKSYPTKKGVVFTAGRWAKFRNFMDEISQHVEALRNEEPVDYKMHLGGGIYVVVKSGYMCVNVRKYWMPKGELQEIPSKFGLALRLKEWDQLVKSFWKIEKFWPELQDAKPCTDDESHANMYAVVDCKECNPFRVGLPEFGLENW